MRHGRHHAPLREAQLPGQGRQGPGLNDEEGLLHRLHRPPGPVLVDIPKDVTMNSYKFEYPKEVVMRSYNPPARA
jgi:glyoxylate carboligase